MTTPVIIDAVIVVVLVGFCVWGAHRGLLRSLAGLVILVVALVGASMLATSFSPGITSLVMPIVREAVLDHVEETADIRLDVPDVEVPVELQELLERLGLDEDVREGLRERAETAVTETGADVATALVESLVGGLVHAVLFALSFVALIILLHVLLSAMDLVLKLPGLHLLNSLGGALVGMIEGALLLFLVVWILRRFGVSFETAEVAKTYVLHIFTTHTPLSVLSLLQ